MADAGGNISESRPDMDELLFRLEAANMQLTSDKKFIAPPSSLAITTEVGLAPSKSFDSSCDSVSLASSLSATLTGNQISQQNQQGISTAGGGDLNEDGGSNKDGSGGSGVTGRGSNSGTNGKLTRSNSSTNGSLCSNSNESSSRENAASSISGVKVEELWRTWSDIITGWNQYSKKINYIRDLIVQHCGIPEHFRPLAWQLLAFSANPEPHAALVLLRERYAQLSRLTSSHEKAIRRDVQRTYPELPFFQSEDNQQSLFNIIKAYSLYDKEVGYCQGSAFLAGLLLMQNLPEEDAFCVLVQLMERQRLRDLYKPSMTELSLRIFLLERCLAEHLPRLYEHLMAQGVHLTTFATQWFLTLFAAVLPLSLSAIVMDLFLVYGLDLLLRLGLAMLQQLEPELLHRDMEGVIKVLQRDSLSAMYSQASEAPERYQTLVNAASCVRLSKKSLTKWEKDFVQAKSKEQEEQVELRRLRTENRLLRQRIENLEKETGELADRLIKGQVCRAEEADVTDSLRSELSRLKRMHAFTVAELDTSLLGAASLQGTVRALKEVICFGDGEGVSPSTESTSSGANIDGSTTFSIPSHLACILENPDVRLIYDEFARLKVTIAELRRETGDLRAQCEHIQQQNGHHLHLRHRGGDEDVYDLNNDAISGDGSCLSTSETASQQVRLDVEALRNHLKEIEAEWQSYRLAASAAPNTNGMSSSASSSSLQQTSGSGGSTSGIGSSGNGGNGQNLTVVRDLQDQLMGLRMKEADTCAQLIHARHAVIEIEAQHQSDARLVRRLQERVEASEADVEASRGKERGLLSKIADLDRQVADLKAQNSEAALRNRILAAEHSQAMAEMRQRTAQLELEKEELQMARKLLRRLDDDISTGDSMAASTMLNGIGSSNGHGDVASNKLLISDSIVLNAGAALENGDEDDVDDIEDARNGSSGLFEDLSINVTHSDGDSQEISHDAWEEEAQVCGIGNNNPTATNVSDPIQSQ